MDIEQDDTLPMDEPSAVVDGPKLTEEPQQEQQADPTEEKPSPVRDESGRFKAKEKGETEGAPPASESDNIPVKALQEERRKRQELEQQLALLQQQAQQNAAPPPSIFEDEQGALNHFGSRVTQEAVQFASFNAKLDTSEMLARQAHAEDFEAAKAEFLKMAEQNPEVRQQALSDPHPWEKAYQIVKNAQTMRELGATNIDELEAKLRAKWEAELKSGLPKFPTSTAQDGSVAGRSGPLWNGPTPDRDLLPMG